MSDYNVYMAKDSTTTQSFLITLIDGTGSMSSEYQVIVDAHNTTFFDLGQKQMKYQWEEYLYDLHPFRCAGSGNITLTFKTIFEKLLNNEYPKNITIVFISDGQERFEFDELKILIEQMKLKYLIQFISVAVGNQFPNTISNILRKSIHNQNSSCPTIFEVERGGSSQQKLQQEFTAIFQQIKQLLNVQLKHFQVNQPVYQTIASKVTTQTVVPNEPFLTKDDGNNKNLQLDGEQIKPTLNPLHIGQLIQNSVQQEVIEAATKKDPNSGQNFEKMKAVVQQIVSKIEINNEEKDQETIKVLVPLLDLVDKFAEGNLRVQDLDEKKMTMLQKNINQKDEITQFIDIFAKDNHVEQIQSKGKVEINLQTKLNKAKLGCYVRSNITKKPLDLFQSIWQIVSQSLIDYQKLIEKDQTQDIKALMIEFKNILDQQLEKIFKYQKFEQLNQKNQIILSKLNEILRRITKLISQKTPINIIDLISIIDFSQNFNVEKFDIEAKQKTIVPEINQYDYLPKSIQPINQNNNVRVSYIATYALLLLGGNKQPTKDDVAHVLQVADIDPNLFEIETLIDTLKNKDLNQIMQEGKLKMSQLIN
ncbi:unnamed protein product [Paramecium primaurelia]|uniref:Uncharacterized protein n=1 Tax=Paramecium primaurelia TaxID=5886 RepID=A0A8S1NRM8_PARPR|nr:unnamed protein product [Paramecium primaurelia]